MSKGSIGKRRIRRGMVAIASVETLAASAIWERSGFAGTTTGANGNPVTISISGSTALKNYVTSGGFTLLEPDTSITLANNLGTNTYGGSSWFDNGGSATSFQLGPTSYTNGNVSTGSTQSANALRLEYHESGSVEGIYELANDQVGPVSFVETSINRNPNGGNAVWINNNQFGGVGSNNVVGQTVNGWYLGPMYGANGGGTVAFGPGVQPTFGATGVNTSSVAGSTYSQAGQNAVQLAVSDVVPAQAFQNTNSLATDTHASQPWLRTISDKNYGVGNTLLPASGLGVTGGNTPLQSPSALNMVAGAVNPRSSNSSTFGTGPWNNGGLANLDSKRLAVTATLYTANPGTGLDRLNRTDAQWLETTGRLGNGAAFDMTTRDVNSGTHNVAALNVGIDPSWAVGINDNGNGNLVSGATSQINIGSGIKFFNKTAGGAQLRPTVQNARMSIGTLSVGDAAGNIKLSNIVSGTNPAYPLRALAYSDSTSGTSNYVAVGATNVITGSYVIYQNEQLVTIKAPDANYSGASLSTWSGVTTGTSPGQVAIQGDDANSNVALVRNNALSTISDLHYNPDGTLSPQATAILSNVNNSSFALIAKGFILPQMMQVEKAQDGLNQSSANAGYDSSLSSLFLATPSLTSNTASSSADVMTAGSADVYGGKGSNSGNFAEGSIPITVSGAGNVGGNWMFGNFNQNGIRVLNSTVVGGLQALAILENSGAGNSVASGSADSTHISATTAMIVTNGITNTYTMPAGMAGLSSSTGPTKGDLIVMGDFDGRGVFDGKSLFEMAVGASVADAGSAIDLSTIGGGANDSLSLKSESLTVKNYDGTTTTYTTETFGDAVRRGSLFKNNALDYLNKYATATMKTEARSVLEGSSVPSGATALGTSDAYTGLGQFTYDSAGTYAYDKHDVNSDGVVDMNDAVLVDKFNTNSYTSLDNQLNATQQLPVSGVAAPISLVMVSQTSNTMIGAADVTEINTGLTGTANANWYGYNLQKSGPGTLDWERTGGTVTVYNSASFEVSGGVVNIGGTTDPFSDNSGLATAGNHLAVAVDNGATLMIAQNHLSNTFSSLTVDVASGAKVDIGTNKLFINYGTGATPNASIRSYLAHGFVGGAWTGSGINSSVAAASNAFSIGYADGADGKVAGLSAGQEEIKFTYAGDATLDGQVNLSDLSVLASHFGSTGAQWDLGDFSYDNTVNLTDFSILASHFGDGVGSPLQDAEVHAQFQMDLAMVEASNPTFAAEVAAAVPEPTGLTLLALGACGLVRRRRRPVKKQA